MNSSIKIIFLTTLMMGSGLQAMDWIASVYNSFFSSKELFVAVKNLNYPEVERLIHAGANINSQDNDGSTPLIITLQYFGFKGTRMLQLLLENGANPNSQNKKGKTALMYGCMQKIPELSEALIEKGADINLQDNDGNTALTLAIISDDNDYKTSHLLINKGADVNIRDNWGNSALIWASFFRNSKKVCAELIAKGADINAKNNKGRTALLNAARKCHYEPCQMLIDNGADATILNYKGNSALKLVAEGCYYSNMSKSRETCKSLIRAMLKPTKEEINSVVVLLGLSKRGKTKELSLAGKDVVKLIGRERLDAIKRKNKEKTRAEIMKIEHKDALRDELLSYLEQL